MKWAQFINNHQKSVLGGPGKKQFVLQPCFFYVLLRHTNVMIDKVFNLFDECAPRCINLSPQEEQGAPLLPERTVKCSILAA